LYERVDLFVTVQNVGDTDLILGNNEGRPWLSFIVSKHGRINDFPVQPERKSNPEPLTLKVGESKTLSVNLTPLFSFREEGEYRACAVIDLPGAGEIMSDPVPFTVFSGRTVWTQVHTVNGSERTYSLIRFSPSVDSTELYLRVKDPAENLIYANLALGQVVASTDPEVYFDPAGNLHVLQPAALSTYLYTRTDPDGKVVCQQVFRSAPLPGSGLDLVPPRLTKLNDGNVVVLGGLSENADTPRERLSNSQSGTKKEVAPQTVADPPPDALPDSSPDAPPDSRPGTPPDTLPLPSGAGSPGASGPAQ
ncbi:MAG TPA: hypothetical protein VL981_07865, partial [Candidatus Methylacidiphilales bacterium]|nr:hypothetical protein [Candidatus Methylacidiphilales bacterium]